MDGDYLIPANASRGKLILGYFRPIDLIIFSIGLGISLLLLIVLQNSMDNTFVTILILLPFAICLLLVVPIPYQHNVLVLLQAMYNFYFVNVQCYRWRGWCIKNGEEPRK